MRIFIFSFFALFVSFQVQATGNTCADLTGVYGNNSLKVSIKQSDCDVFDYHMVWTEQTEQRHQYINGFQTMGMQDGVTCRLEQVPATDTLHSKILVGCKNVDGDSSAPTAKLSVWQLSEDGDLIIQTYNVYPGELDLENLKATVERSRSSQYPQVLFRKK
jgi:hypothetical protein